MLQFLIKTDRRTSSNPLGQAPLHPHSKDQSMIVASGCPMQVCSTIILENPDMTFWTDVNVRAPCQLLASILVLPQFEPRLLFSALAQG